MNKKSKVAQKKHNKRKETLKERARAERPAGTKATVPARTKYEMEEAAPAPVKAAKPKAAGVDANWTLRGKVADAAVPVTVYVWPGLLTVSARFISATVPTVKVYG